MCLPNKLCNSKKDGTGEIIRGPCATQPYDPVECGEICLYGKSIASSPSSIEVCWAALMNWCR